jgi:hypothetical protein
VEQELSKPLSKTITLFLREARQAEITIICLIKLTMEIASQDTSNIINHKAIVDRT